MAVVEHVSKAELVERRRRLLARVGMEWQELRARAAHFSLTDEERNVYETVRAINYLLHEDTER